MSEEQATLGEFWRVRNAAAVTLGLCDDQMRRAVRGASVEQLVSLIETFSPARSTGPEWTRTFEPLVERLWVWRDGETIAALADAFRAKGMPWMAVANALAQDRRADVRQPAGARLPAFTLL